MKTTDKARPVLALGLLLLAALLLALGLRRGEGALVLQKAVNLCFECIGLG